MTEDLAGFRKLARKVYETMAQDVGDVLANEHIQLNQFYQERIQIYNDKMSGEIDEIFEMNPTFDFDKYEEYGESYLKQLFPLAQKVRLYECSNDSYRCIDIGRDRIVDWNERENKANRVGIESIVRMNSELFDLSIFMGPKTKTDRNKLILIQLDSIRYWFKEFSVLKFSINTIVFTDWKNNFEWVTSNGLKEFN